MGLSARTGSPGVIYNRNGLREIACHGIEIHPKSNFMTHDYQALDIISSDKL
ncbi:MAG: hypothetical protein KAI35_00710 [Desulfobulbaceae bacterium]|nr:hypothetical protein [Desulfobulbaceae bacterium]